ncbi:hypothetical protein DSO57_1009636 [Entomophthora muscae]|uniref:Uncharacterized protein n=1 Tax=Entomophthora muscae TaxID=34485 RepID=A0ACC2U676_9FUNG|nr:hypothetical protein DSO57_1009636 [Entomophthora muscae]
MWIWVLILHHLETASYYPVISVTPAHDFRKLGFFYITVLGLADQVVPHTGSWHTLATAVNYLVRIAPIVYLAFQARPTSPAGVQPDSGMSHDTDKLYTCFLSPVLPVGEGEVLVPKVGLVTQERPHLLQSDAVR